MTNARDYKAKNAVWELKCAVNYEKTTGFLRFHPGWPSIRTNKRGGQVFAIVAVQKSGWLANAAQKKGQNLKSCPSLLPQLDITSRAPNYLAGASAAFLAAFFFAGFLAAFFSAVASFFTSAFGASALAAGAAGVAALAGSAGLAGVAAGA